MCTIHILIVGWLAAEQNEVNQLRWNGNNDLLPGQTHFLNGNLLTIGSFGRGMQGRVCTTKIDVRYPYIIEGMTSTWK